jgi:DNA-binding Lrp family transcriptional regulator
MVHYVRILTEITNIDALDISILNLLKANARMTVKSIAENLDRRRATIYARLQKLEKNNVIQRFTIAPNYVSMGLDITAFILVSITDKAFEKYDSPFEISQRISQMKGVTEVYSITGEYDYLLKLRVKSLEDIGNEVVFNLRKYFPVNRTLTLPVFFTGKEELSNDMII